MDTDLALVLGILMALLSVPAMISAFSSDRSPRVATVLAMLGGALIVYAITSSPVSYRGEDVPQAVMRVIARLIGR